MIFENSCIKIRNTSPAPCLNVKTVIEHSYTMKHYSKIWLTTVEILFQNILQLGLCSVPKHNFTFYLHLSLNIQTLLIGLFHNHIQLWLNICLV